MRTWPGCAGAAQWVTGGVWRTGGIPLGAAENGGFGAGRGRPQRGVLMYTNREWWRSLHREPTSIVQRLEKALSMPSQPDLSVSIATYAYESAMRLEMAGHPDLACKGFRRVVDGVVPSTFEIWRGTVVDRADALLYLFCAQWVLGEDPGPELPALAIQLLEDNWSEKVQWPHWRAYAHVIWSSVVAGRQDVGRRYLGIIEPRAPKPSLGKPNEPQVLRMLVDLQPGATLDEAQIRLFETFVRHRVRWFPSKRPFDPLNAAPAALYYTLYAYVWAQQVRTPILPIDVLRALRDPEACFPPTEDNLGCQVL